MILSESDFSKLIISAPLISIDLCILKGRELLTGKRINPPAQDYFFVPGGRILKSELKQNALDRILRNELGLLIKDNDKNLIKDLGIFEHFYDDNFLGNKNFSTHYIVLAYLIPFEILKKGFADDMKNVESINEVDGIYLLPNEAWARRVVGVMAHRINSTGPGPHVIAIDKGQTLQVSLRGEEGIGDICSMFGGGGRATAGGIDALPKEEMTAFMNEVNSRRSA